MQSDVSAFQDEEAFPELGGRWEPSSALLGKSTELNRDLELPGARAVIPPPTLSTLWVSVDWQHSVWFFQRPSLWEAWEAIPWWESATKSSKPSKSDSYQKS